MKINQKQIKFVSSYSAFLERTHFYAERKIADIKNRKGPFHNTFKRHISSFKNIVVQQYIKSIMQINAVFPQ